MYFDKFQATQLPFLIPSHDGSAGTKCLTAFALLGAGVSGLLSCTTIAYSDEAEHGLEPPIYPWPHKGVLSAYDHPL